LIKTASRRCSAALLLKKPMFFQGLDSPEPVKSFEHAGELDRAERVIEEIAALDRLCSKLSEITPPDGDLFLEEDLTYRQLLFDVWSRRLLQLKPSLSGISIDQAASLFRLLRSGEERPPFRMGGFDETFVNDLTAQAGKTEDLPLLRASLSSLWEEFRRECESADIAGLGPVIPKFFLILSPEKARTD